MSKQHFYSRVPARMSIFNRADGFDTFAYSEGLEREFIEKDLSAIYDNKPSNNDAALIRSGKLAPVYCQNYTKSGVLTQGCLSFLPLDYTGERSAYMSHILVPDEAETAKLLDDPDNACLNPEMFKKDISEFSFTSFDSTPDSKYPDKKYEPVKAAPTESLSGFDSAMMKRLIFCMLNIACGKGKTVFISMPFDISEMSLKSLDFMNSLMQIFPYHMRRAFSFVTYTDDYTRYSAFNVRFIPEGSAEIPTSKGITLHFGSKFAVGLSDDVVATNAKLVGFFYNLIKNDAVRREFLYFMNSAVNTVPELKKVNLKTLNELVFVFEQCSGLFSEKNVLPNDESVFDFVCAYEKHRAALNGEYRTNALKCLKRYPAAHEPIPKDIFNRIQKIYPTEPVASKRNVMNAVLDLIHTDTMRDKLFAFIKSNYDSEDEDMHSLICSNLCRVYYGGFLQPQILELFDRIFKSESEETRNDIVERLLLTIRTPAIMMQIIEFFDKHYGVLTSEQKDKLIAVFYEMLPECDKLSAELVKLINAHIGSEKLEVTSDVKSKVNTLCDNNLRTKEPKLMPILIAEPGFCCDAITERVFTKCGGKKIFDHYVGFYYELPFERKLSLIKEIWDAAPETPETTATAFAELLCELENASDKKIDVYSLMELDRVVTDLISAGGVRKAFASIYSEKYVRPALYRAIPEVFSIKRRADGLQTFIKYSKDRPYIMFAEGYKPVSAFINICQSALKQKDAEMIGSFSAFVEKNYAVGAAEYLKNELFESEDIKGEQFDVTRFVLKVMTGYIKNRSFNFTETYNDFVTSVSAKLREANEIPQDNITAEASNKAVSVMLKAAEEICASESFAANRNDILAVGGPLEGCLKIYFASDKKSVKWLDEYVTFEKFEPSFAESVSSLIISAKPKPANLIFRIFGRK